MIGMITDNFTSPGGRKKQHFSVPEQCLEFFFNTLNSFIIMIET